MSTVIDQSGGFSMATDYQTDEFTLFADALKALKSDTLDPLDADHGPAVIWKEVCQSKLEDQSLEMTSEQRESWSLERSTWQLVQMLYTDRTATVQSIDSKLANNPYLPPLNVVNLHLSQSQDLLELSTIRDWLHTCPSNTHPAEIRRGYWPYTKAAIKHYLQKQPHQSRDPTKSFGQSGLLHSMDPDAPLRSNARANSLRLDANQPSALVQNLDAVNDQGQLDHLDEEYDRAMVKTLYEYVRAGEINLALDFCRQCDHPWRAASLSGGRLFYDPVLSTLESDLAPFAQDEALNDTDPMDIIQNEPRPSFPYRPMNRSGCLNRKLWKSMCLHMASNKSLPTYEQALYGALAGEVNSVLPVCHTWEDHIWCYINSIFEDQVDQILDTTQMGYYWSHDCSFPRANDAEDSEDSDDSNDNDLPSSTPYRSSNPHASSNRKPNSASKPNIKLSLSKAFDKVLRSDIPFLSESARNPFHVAQMWLAINKINDLFTTFFNRLKSASQELTREHLSHLLRFFTHLILFLRSIDEPVDDEASNAIIRAYVQVLEAQNKHELIAFYVAELQQESGVETYARYLISIGPLADRQTRRTALLRALEHGLDLSRVACTAVKLTLQEITHVALEANSDHGLSRFSHQLTDKQKELIRSLEWLTIDSSTYLDALIQANSLVRYFLTAGHPNAAREVIRSMPTDLLSVIAKEKNLIEDSQVGDTFANVPNEILEFTQYRDFFHCLELHVQVNEVLSQRPMTSAPITEVQAFTEALKEICNQMHAAVVEILCSEWLQDIKMDFTQEEPQEAKPISTRRTEELSLIRNIYIPELIFRLHGALVDSGAYVTSNLRRALDLAVLVADESFKNYLEFLPTQNSKNHKMKDYLREIRLVTLMILKRSGTHPLKPIEKDK
ncbi:hypothetical protein O181_059268 [Austropuccinia psidii MF-1]|uniref:Nuclear pore complex protein n=1 Tax=Austropuccinia psidii MF-1 TaxID=1389203 RepID=A0A9Q3EIG7_9BASI|nr:hypothetical protein [Austropuccinia psidii MF-1]